MKKSYKKTIKTNYVSMFGVILTKIYFIMDKVFKYFNDFFKGLVGLIMGLLALSITADFLFSSANADGTRNGALNGIDAIGNISHYVGEFAGGGVVGLIGLLIVWSLISNK
jgi:hypothetical protein